MNKIKVGDTVKVTRDNPRNYGKLGVVYDIYKSIAGLDCCSITFINGRSESFLCSDVQFISRTYSSISLKPKNKPDIK